MKSGDWEPIYLEILKDMEYDRIADENSAKILKTTMMNAKLITNSDLCNLIKDTVSVFGAADSLVSDILKHRPEGTLISAGSATSIVMSMDIVPDIVVTDLDGDIDPQINASKKGAITLLHAHGDNINLVVKHAKKFTDNIVLTTQSQPDSILHNFGGFTDGDRAVCLARHFNAKKIYLYGFDYDNPSKKGSNSLTKLKKLSWAKRIIGNSCDIIKI